MPVGTQWRSLVVNVPTGTPVTTYTATVVGVAEKDTEHETCPADPDGDTVSRDGAVTTIRGSAGNGGCDAYRVQGYVRDIAVDGESLPASTPVEFSLGGERLDLDADLPEPMPGEAPEASMSVTGQDFTGTFDASGSIDPDGSVTGHEWNIGGIRRDGETVQYTFEEAGTYSVTLTVVDNDGRRADASTVVTVPFDPQGESVTAAMTVDVDGNTVALDGSPSSADSGIATYEWDIADTLKTGQTVEHTFEEAGTYDITLTVTSNEGSTATATSTIASASTPRLLPPWLDTPRRRSAFVLGISALGSVLGQELGRNDPEGLTFFRD